MARNHSAIVWTDDPKDWAEYLRKPTQQELNELFQGMEQAEKDGMFDDMFTGECRQETELPIKELLLDSIKPDMKLYKSFFMKIYGYEISYPGFSETALKKLEEIGCQRAREYYEQFTTEYENEYHDKMIEVSEWYQKKLDNEWERKVREYERKEGKEQRKQEKNIKLSKEAVATEILKW